jgi:hypothetical protein
LIVRATDTNRNHFHPGHFMKLATDTCGHWMKYVYFIGSQISLYGLYNSTVIVAECTLPPYFQK